MSTAVSVHGEVWVSTVWVRVESDQYSIHYWALEKYQYGYTRVKHMYRDMQLDIW